MRDLYHRQDKLTYWVKRVNTDLEEPDKADVLKLVEYMQDRERAILWIMRCITAILIIRKQLSKPFRDASKDDIRSILKWMEQKGYKASTNEKFRQILKLFYKTVYGEKKYYANISVPELSKLLKAYRPGIWDSCADRMADMMRTFQKENTDET